jgi:hypothetical protein
LEIEWIECSWHQCVSGHGLNRAATARQGVKKMIACHVEVDKVDGFYCKISVLHFVKSPSGDLVLLPVLLDNGDNSPGDTPTIQEEVSLP